MMLRKLVTASTALLIAVGGIVACQTKPAPHYDGKELFLTYCASCHGPTGAGDGPMAPHLADRLPDLRTLTARSGGEFPRDRLVEMIDGRSMRSVHGTANMPVWGFQFRREEGMTDDGLRNVQARIDALADHIRGLQQ